MYFAFCFFGCHKAKSASSSELQVLCARHGSQQPSPLNERAPPHVRSRRIAPDGVAATPPSPDADELLGDDDDDFDDETCIEAFVFTLQEVVYSRWFNNAVLFVILANSVCMALEDPVIEDKWSEPGQAALAYLDFVFIGLFTIEMTLKLLALGVVEYLRDVWNALDGFIVLVSYVNLMFASAGGASFTVLRVLRILRALRPLRTIKRIQGLRILVVSLLKSFNSVVNILIIGFATWTISAIVGMQLYLGEFRYRCVDPTTGEYPEDVFSEMLCLPEEDRQLGGRGCPAPRLRRLGRDAPLEHHRWRAAAPPPARNAPPATPPARSPARPLTRPPAHGADHPAGGAQHDLRLHLDGRGGRGDVLAQDVSSLYYFDFIYFLAVVLVGNCSR